MSRSNGKVASVNGSVTVSEPEILPAVTDVTDVDGAALPVLAKMVNRYHAQAVEGQRSALEAAWHAGTALLEVKSRLQHGEWLPWLVGNTQVSERTAQVYMRIASNTQRAADLKPEQSIRKALEVISEPEPSKPKRKKPEQPPPETSNPFLKPMYRHLSQMVEHGLAIKKVLNHKKFPEHQHEVFRQHAEWVEWVEKTLAEVQVLLRTYTDQKEMF
jgi:mannose/cellobiose epimerase-like protein (N-acyl-D-glucosamine 2-epimerase family)